MISHSIVTSHAWGRGKGKELLILTGAPMAILELRVMGQGTWGRSSHEDVHHEGAHLTAAAQLSLYLVFSTFAGQSISNEVGGAKIKRVC